MVVPWSHKDLLTLHAPCYEDRFLVDYGDACSLVSLEDAVVGRETREICSSALANFRLVGLGRSTPRHYEPNFWVVVPTPVSPMTENKG